MSGDPKQGALDVLAAEAAIDSEDFIGPRRASRAWRAWLAAHPSRRDEISERELEARLAGKIGRA